MLENNTVLGLSQVINYFWLHKAGVYRGRRRGVT